MTNFAVKLDQARAIPHYEPLLPNGGNKERRIIERLERLARVTAWDGSNRPSFAIRQWHNVLPFDPRNAGRYYTRRPVTPKTDADLFKGLTTLKENALSQRNGDWEWFAQMLLDGLPEPVSDFEMSCFL